MILSNCALIDLRPLLRVGIERVAELAFLGLRGEFVRRRRHGPCLARTISSPRSSIVLGSRNMPIIEPLPAAFEIGVGEDDVRAFAAEFEGDPLERNRPRSS